MRPDSKRYPNDGRPEYKQVIKTVLFGGKLLKYYTLERIK